MRVENKPLLIASSFFVMFTIVVALACSFSCSYRQTLFPTYTAQSSALDLCFELSVEPDTGLALLHCNDHLVASGVLPRRCRKPLGISNAGNGTSPVTGSAP